VENGYGFFGAGEGIQQEWGPAVEATRNAGFNFVQRCDFLFPMEVAECMSPPIPCLNNNVDGVWETWLQ
jgi:hypothetical protein